MTPNMQTMASVSSSKPAPVDRAKQLAAALLSERGEASGAQVARELHHVLRALDADDRHSFQRYLATEFQPDRTALQAAAERYLADSTGQTSSMPFFRRSMLVLSRASARPAAEPLV